MVLVWGMKCCEGSGYWGDGQNLKVYVIWKCLRGDVDGNWDENKFFEYCEILWF